jgi:hypothetical protein
MPELDALLWSFHHSNMKLYPAQVKSALLQSDPMSGQKQSNSSLDTRI